MPSRLCLSPALIDGEPVNCNKCKNCRLRRLDNWSLMVLGEGQSGDDMWSITLTYREGEEGADYLRYNDVQRFFKRVRKAGHKFRYLCAGELGGQTGRPHWHLMVWWGSTPPEKGELLGTDAAFNDRWAFPFWPHGHTHVDEGVEPSFARYICKYIQKQDGHAGKFVPSRNPGVGMDYFDEHARRHARNGSVWSKNVFKIEGWEGSLPYERWRRYRKIFVEEWVKCGRDPLALIGFEAYENILLDDDRAEFEEFSADLVRADKLLPQARDFQEHAVKLTLLDNVKGGRPTTERLSSYKRGSVRFMRFEHSGPKRWLLGKFHLGGGYMVTAQSGKAKRKIDIPISAAQFRDILDGKRPLPENDPLSQSDWLTEEAAQYRLAHCVPPVVRSAPALSHNPNYRMPKKTGCQS